MRIDLTRDGNVEHIASLKSDHASDFEWLGDWNVTLAQSSLRVAGVAVIDMSGDVEVSFPILYEHHLDMRIDLRLYGAGFNSHGTEMLQAVEAVLAETVLLFFDCYVGYGSDSYTQIYCYARVMAEDEEDAWASYYYYQAKVDRYAVRDDVGAIEGVSCSEIYANTYGWVQEFSSFLPWHVAVRDFEVSLIDGGLTVVANVQANASNSDVSVKINGNDFDWNDYDLTLDSKTATLVTPDGSWIATYDSPDLVVSSSGVDVLRANSYGSCFELELMSVDFSEIGLFRSSLVGDVSVCTVGNTLQSAMTLGNGGDEWLAAELNGSGDATDINNWNVTLAQSSLRVAGVTVIDMSGDVEVSFPILYEYQLEMQIYLQLYGAGFNSHGTEMLQAVEAVLSETVLLFFDCYVGYESDSDTRIYCYARVMAEDEEDAWASYSYYQAKVDRYAVCDAVGAIEGVSCSGTGGYYSYGWVQEFSSFLPWHVAVRDFEVSLIDGGLTVVANVQADASNSDVSVKINGNIYDANDYDLTLDSKTATLVTPDGSWIATYDSPDLVVSSSGVDVLRANSYGSCFELELMSVDFSEIGLFRSSLVGDVSVCTVGNTLQSAMTLGNGGDEWLAAELNGSGDATDINNWNVTLAQSSLRVAGVTVIDMSGDVEVSFPILYEYQLDMRIDLQLYGAGFNSHGTEMLQAVEAVLSETVLLFFDCVVAYGSDSYKQLNCYAQVMAEDGEDAWASYYYYQAKVDRYAVRDAVGAIEGVSCSEIYANTYGWVQEFSSFLPWHVAVRDSEVIFFESSAALFNVDAGGESLVQWTANISEVYMSSSGSREFFENLCGVVSVNTQVERYATAVQLFML
jgi:hypothetical protein